MDSTAGDLNHGVQELNLAVERTISRNASAENLAYTISSGEKHQSSLPNAPTETKEVENEKHRNSGSPSSSGSSSDVVQMEKLDSHIVKIGEVKKGEEAYAHLPPHEREIVRKQLEIPSTKVGYFTLYRYATRWDLIIVFISCFGAIAGGAVMPLMTVCVQSEIQPIFQDHSCRPACQAILRPWHCPVSCLLHLELSKIT